MNDNKQYLARAPAEYLDFYEVPGLYPVHVDDCFKDGRYEIWNKLGWGGFATVWLAHDKETNEFVSIKTVSAEFTETSQELRILEHIRKDTSQHPGRKYVPRLLDHFYETKGGYRHLFLVLEFLGPPVRDVQCYYPNRRFSTASSRRFSRQLLLAVEYLHSIGIVHGDIHSKNILFRLPDAVKDNEDEVIEELGLDQVRFGEVYRKDGAPLEEGVPRYLVIPTYDHTDHPYKYIKKRLYDFTDIQLIDFTSSFFSSDPPDDIPMVIYNTPPELVFQMPLGKAIDIWEFACTVHFLYTNQPLFDSVSKDRRRHISTIYSILGESSARWLQAGLNNLVLEKNGKDSKYSKLQLCDESDSQGLEADLQEFYNIGESGSDKAFMRFLRKCLVVDPSQRPTATDLIGEEWVQGEEDQGDINNATCFFQKRLVVNPSKRPTTTDEKSEEWGV